MTENKIYLNFYVYMKFEEDLEAVFTYGDVSDVLINNDLNQLCETLCKNAANIINKKLTSWKFITHKDYQRHLEELSDNISVITADVKDNSVEVMIDKSAERKKIQQEILESKNVTEQNVKNVITNLLDTFNGKFVSDNGDFIESLYDNDELVDWLKNPDQFRIFFGFKFERVLKYLYVKIYPNITENDAQYLTLLALNYDMVKNLIENLIEPNEGTSCIADKSRFLIKAYKNHVITGELPDMTIKDKCYWKPHFGSAENWMSLIKCIVQLKYGKFQHLLDAYYQLINE